MGTLNETTNQAVMERVANQASATDEWWTALSFEDGDFALEPDPVLTPADDTVESIELRLFSF